MADQSMQIDPEPDASNRGTKRTAIQADIVADETGGPDAYHIYLDSFSNGAPGSSHFFGAGQMGVPGVTQYPNWKPPSPSTAKHNKTFYLEIENTNFTFGDEGLLAPYYAFPWQYIPWYLHQGEFKWYTSCTNYARFKSVRFQINVIGARLPFTTNDETASVANSQVDQVLDVFKSMEKIMPFMLYDTKNTTDVTTPSALHNSLTRLYGKVSHSTGDTEVSACQGYRRWHVQPLFPKGRTHKNVQNFQTYPAFAHNKIMSADLRTFKGPLFEMAHKCRNGIFVVAASSKPEYTDVFTSDEVATYAVLPYQNKQIWMSETHGDSTQQNESGMSGSHTVYTYVDGLVGVDTITSNEGTSHTRVYRSSIETALPNAAYALRNPSAVGGTTKPTSKVTNYMDGYHQTIEGNMWTSGQEFNNGNFASIFAGVRPQMNGSKYQQGITQIEIKTECEIEYSVYWPLPAPFPDTPSQYHFGGQQDVYGLTNDIDVPFVFHGWQMPNYAHHHKQPWLHFINSDL